MCEKRCDQPAEVKPQQRNDGKRGQPDPLGYKQITDQQSETDGNPLPVDKAIGQFEQITETEACYVRPLIDN
ncbi:hypothetical protein SRABI106_04353 [Rahnella aquatilis]|jgi:hypothetical protein|nr:hypothetical protein SRABI106_04353 [Rahnella aquatilis]